MKLLMFDVVIVVLFCFDLGSSSLGTLSPPLLFSCLISSLCLRQIDSGSEIRDQRVDEVVDV